MAYTQASNKAVQKYNKNNYDDLRIRVKKGKAEKIKAYAKNKGMSLNGYINHLIETDMGEVQSEDTKEVSATVQTEQTNIEMLNLSIRTYNALKRAGLNTVEDVTKYVKKLGEERASKSIGTNNYKEYLLYLKNYNKC